MRRTFLSALVVAGVVALAFPQHAAAQGEPGTASPSRKRGLELKVGLGVNSGADMCTIDPDPNNRPFRPVACGGLDPSASLRFQALFRVVPYFSLGVHWAFLFGNADDARTEVDMTWATVFGGEFRGILPVGKIDFYLGIVLGLIHQRLVGSNGASFDVQRTNGFAFGFGWGADYYIVPKVAIGLQFWLYKGFHWTACDDFGSSTACDDLRDDAIDGIETIWSFGLNATFFLPM